MLNREMRIALASKKAYRPMQEFEASFEQVRETVEESDTESLQEDLQRMAEDDDPA